MNRSSLLIAFVAVSAILAGCGSPQAPQGDRVSIDLARIEQGVGSPIPLAVVVEYRLPSTCSQLTSITNTVEEGQITIEIRGGEFGEDCQRAELVYRISIPLNSVGFLHGDYSVRVNGVNAGSFSFESRGPSE
ncbi:MAG: hypothetical protein A2Z37_04975 [Chloroflexi bacterium RBG_19FT_COMBO_62_14]|nr:MAG: hypothetical protein A2Z37_04975 [Chloroflexi bacterium RBG_19FT_COMBO_62_14]